MPPLAVAPHLSFLGYVQVLLAFIALWVILHGLQHGVLLMCDGVYRGLEGRDMYEYKSYVNGFFHALVSTSLAIYCTWYAW